MVTKMVTTIANGNAGAKRGLAPPLARRLVLILCSLQCYGRTGGLSVVVLFGWGPGCLIVIILTVYATFHAFFLCINLQI